MTKYDIREIFFGLIYIAFFLVPFTSLFIIWSQPILATKLAIEDGPVETATAFFLLLASITTLIKATHIWRQREFPDFKVVAILGFCVALLFFSFAGEEISWGQRLLGVESNDFIKEYNWQGETNLHNFQTDAFNIIYHYGALFVLVWLPIFQLFFLKLFKSIRATPLTAFIGPAKLALPTVVIAGMLDPRFTFSIEKLWVAVLYAIALLISVFGLAFYYQTVPDKNNNFRYAYTVSIFLILFSIFISYLQIKSNLPNTISEYKELVVGLGLFGFALFWPYQYKHME